MSVPRVMDQIREVFVSSTAKDVKDYRTSVKDALESISAAVFLQESWAEPARDVVDLCLHRLAESDAYLGVFGYRYGWIPEGRDRSITELEYDRALEIWRASQVPPVFLFVPETGSQAATELGGAAEVVLALDYPYDPEKREDSKRRQARFRERILISGLFIRQFDSLAKLCMLAPTNIQNWNLAILKTALEGRRDRFGGIPLEDLGAIGRDVQVSALKKALAALELSAYPGMCVLVHGREDAGQLAFRKFLEAWNGWGLDDAPLVITPPHEQFDEAALRASALGALGPSRTAVQTGFDDVASAILVRCSRAPVVLMLSRFETVESICEFQRSFWAPLLAALLVKSQNALPPYRLTVALTSLHPLPALVPASIWQGALDHVADYSRLLRLPELTDFSVADVATWLKEIGVDATRRSSIAASVTREDGIPRNVFDRLNTNGFWSTLR
jgi:hypothetical protein